MVGFFRGLVLGILGSGLSVIRFSGVSIFRCQVFQVFRFPGASFFKVHIFQGSSFSGVRSSGARFICGQFSWGQVWLVSKYDIFQI